MIIVSKSLHLRDDYGYGRSTSLRVDPRIGFSAESDTVVFALLSYFIAFLEANTADLLAALPSNLRPWSKSHDLGSDRGILIAGPRGVGKTTFLLSQVRKHGRAIYLSGDHPKVNIFGLYDLAAGIFARGYQTLIVDEVHLLETGHSI